MSPRTPGGCGAYARALEQALSRIRGRPVVLSPRDWMYASDWHDRRIPLSAVLECLDEAAARARGRGATAGPRSLAYIAPAVEERWKVIRSGRSQPSSAAPWPSRDRVRQAWARAAESCGEGSDLSALIAEILSKLDGGLEPSDADDELDRRLLSTAPATLVSSARDEVARELEPFRSRMPATVFRDTRERAAIERVRRSMKLPRLAATSRE